MSSAPYVTGAEATLPPFDDASMENGREYLLGIRRRKGFLGLSDDSPPLAGESIQRRHVMARRSWQPGRPGTQVSWSMHGRVRILLLADGSEVAVWLDEAIPALRRTPG